MTLRQLLDAINRMQAPMTLKSVDAPNGLSSPTSVRALDWLNFLLAALQTAFGPFLTIALADRGWLPASIGFVLTAGGIAGLIAQMPAGELIDRIASKRTLVGAGVGAVILAALIFGLRPDFASVFVAAVIQGVGGSIIGPGIAAISLGLVGHSALAERLGRNQRFASVGGLTAAVILGVVGYLLPSPDRFFLTAALGLPVLLALFRIRAAEINFCRACGAPDQDTVNPRRVSRVVLFKDHRLLVFAACLFLFQLTNASLLPLLGEKLVNTEGRGLSLILSMLIVGPQLIVALLAPWVGRTAATWGRRPLLIIGLGVVPIRSGTFALTTDPSLLVLIQALDGLTGAVLGVLTALVIADLTNGTGRFNLAQGFVGTLSGVGASFSTSISGLVVERFGHMTGFLSVTIVGLITVAILWMFMPETKPSALQNRTGMQHPPGL
jgi:MFS family permease